MGDTGLIAMIKASPQLSQIELNRCECTEASIKYFIKELPNLKFLDLTGIPGIPLQMVLDIQNKKPGLNLRNFRSEKLDVKDTGLRCPRRVIEEDGKKKKKK